MFGTKIIGFAVLSLMRAISAFELPHKCKCGGLDIHHIETGKIIPNDSKCLAQFLQDFFEKNEDAAGKYPLINNGSIHLVNKPIIGSSNTATVDSVIDKILYIGACILTSYCYKVDGKRNGSEKAEIEFKQFIDEEVESVLKAVNNSLKDPNHRDDLRRMVTDRIEKVHYFQNKNKKDEYELIEKEEKARMLKRAFSAVAASGVIFFLVNLGSVPRMARTKSTNFSLLLISLFTITSYGVALCHYGGTIETFKENMSHLDDIDNRTINAEKTLAYIRTMVELWGISGFY